MASTIGIVSLSSGVIGEDFVKHEVDLGGPTTQRPGTQSYFLPHSLKGLDFIKEHPEARAEDLIQAFSDDSIDMIYAPSVETIPIACYLTSLKMTNYKRLSNTKIFLGFSDTTMNHLMLHKLGVKTFTANPF